MDEWRLLLVEDDPVSADFLAQALAALPARVDLAGSIAEARALALAARHALWLVDAHLPDGSGLDCRRELRAVAEAPALALTAGAPRAELDALCAGGYLEVLMKPVSIALLQGTVRRVLGGEAPHMPVAAPAGIRSGGKLPDWEDARALAALGGNPAALAKLRRLFLDELPGQLAQLHAAHAAADASAAGAVLHKLRASCGFVGAARLGERVEALARAPLDAAILRELGFAAEDATASARAQS